MGILEILFIVAVSMGTGYQAGKAGQKVESVETGKVCFDQEYNGRKKGCYDVVDSKSAVLKKSGTVVSTRK